MVKNVQDKYKLLKKSKHRTLGEKKLTEFLDTKVIFPTQTVHLPKQLSPLEHESCREVIDSLTSENAKLKEDIDTLQKKGKVRTKQNPFIQSYPV